MLLFVARLASFTGKVILNVDELFVCSHAFVSITERANGTEQIRVSRHLSADRKFRCFFQNTSEDP